MIKDCINLRIFLWLEGGGECDNHVTPPQTYAEYTLTNENIVGNQILENICFRGKLFGKTVPPNHFYLVRHALPNHLLFGGTCPPK